MENKFYQDNLEDFLKERTDNFRMYPSKRVWHGIYNNLHPSRKWPSLVIWVLIISSIAYVGVTNKNQVIFSGGNGKITTTEKIEPSAFQINYSTQSLKNSYQLTIGQNEINPLSTDNSGSNAINKNKEELINSNNQSYQQGELLSTTNSQTSNNENSIDTRKVGIEQSQMTVIPNEIQHSENQIVSISINTDISNKEKETVLINKIDTETENKNLIAIKLDQKSDKEWIEDFAFHNKPSISKWKKQIDIEYYFTPSVGYRVLTPNTKYKTSTSSLVAPLSNYSDYEKALNQSAEINIELGSSIIYSYSKNWKIKAGIQFNYTNYAISAYELKHPTITTILLNDLNNGFPVLKPKSTNLANSLGVSSKRLNNNTYQVSLPLGADFKLAGKSNLKWYAGATIQPTYIMGGNAYLISSDLKNYVADNSFIRKWNLNAGFETFLSYKTVSGITINAGPQFRYQILSTYDKQYSYDENLYNIGMKIGIITRF